MDGRQVRMAGEEASGSVLGLQTSAKSEYGTPSACWDGSRSLMSTSRPWFHTPSCSDVQNTVTVCTAPGCSAPAQGDSEKTPALRVVCRTNGTNVHTNR